MLDGSIKYTQVKSISMSKVKGAYNQMIGGAKVLS